MKKTYFILILLFTNVLMAQDNRRLKVEAAFMYHFTKYIEWPINKKSGDFIFQVYGDDDLLKELQMISALKKVVSNQTIVVKKCTKFSEINECHILFIDANKIDDLEEYLFKLKKSNILIISNSKNGFKKGCSIIFKSNDDKLSFELSPSSIESSGLILSNQLLLMSNRNN